MFKKLFSLLDLVINLLKGQCFLKPSKKYFFHFFLLKRDFLKLMFDYKFLLIHSYVKDKKMPWFDF